MPPCKVWRRPAFPRTGAASLTMLANLHCPYIRYDNWRMAPRATQTYIIHFLFTQGRNTDFSRLNKLRLTMMAWGVVRNIGVYPILCHFRCPNVSAWYIPNSPLVIDIATVSPGWKEPSSPAEIKMYPFTGSSTHTEYWLTSFRRPAR